MTISETQTAYFNTLINLGVTETDAQQAAHILYEVDSQRPRTAEEQALISQIFNQVQDQVQSQPTEITGS